MIPQPSTQVGPSIIHAPLFVGSRARRAETDINQCHARVGLVIRARPSYLGV